MEWWRSEQQSCLTLPQQNFVVVEKYVASVLFLFLTVSLLVYIFLLCPSVMPHSLCISSPQKFVLRMLSTWNSSYTFFTWFILNQSQCITSRENCILFLISKYWQRSFGCWFRISKWRTITNPKNVWYILLIHVFICFHSFKKHFWMSVCPECLGAKKI